MYYKFKIYEQLGGFKKASFIIFVQLFYAILIYVIIFKYTSFKNGNNNIKLILINLLIMLINSK